MLGDPIRIKGKQERDPMGRRQGLKDRKAQMLESPGYLSITRNVLNVSKNDEVESDIENSVNFEINAVLIWCKKLRGNFAGDLERGRPNKGDCSRIIETCDIGGSVRSFNWLIKYINYIRNIYLRTKINNAIGNVFDSSLAIKSRETRRARDGYTF